MKNKDDLVRIKTIARDIFSGTIAGITVTLSGHPFDTLKVRLQTQPYPPLYNGLIDCFKKTIKWEGIGGLYKGVSSPLAGQMFFRANMFFSHAEMKRFLSKDGTQKLTNKQLFFAGGWAWFTGTAFEGPIDVVKSQLQVQIIKSKTIPGYVAPFSTMTECAKFIIKENGLIGLYKGVVAHLMRNIPAGAIHLGTNDLIKMYFADRDGVTVSHLKAWQNLVAGGIGGFLFWSIFFPFDVMKSSLQSDSILKSERRYNGVVDVTKKLYAEGGLRRFYRGFSPCLLRAIPANAIMLWTVSAITEAIPVI